MAGDPNVHALLVQLAGQQGFHVLTANNGIEALQVLRQGEIDAALIDLLLPGIDGLQILREAKNLRIETPIVIFTDYVGVGPAVDTMKQGAANYLLKPLQGREILKALEEALRGRMCRKTARARHEKRSVQAHKMETLGRLTCGAAHDLNNQMTIVLGYSHLLLEELDASNSMRDSLEEIARAAERAAALTQQLLSWGRKEEPAAQVIDLNFLVKGLEKMLRRLLGEDIALITQLDPGLDPVLGDQSQIEQVVLNLVLNARDAMPHGGKLIITTANTTSTPRDGSEGPLVPVVSLSVGDTGNGIQSDVKPHVFEPFFTTKKGNGGTGLGLTIVQQIVGQLGGEVRADSIPGNGSTFTITFPATRHTGEPATEELPDTEPVRERSQTILVVEDDAGVRSGIREFLNRYGYSVLEAGDAEDAVAISRQHQGGIDLLLTDVVLPTEDGPALARRLAVERPDLKVAYISGYPDATLVQHGVGDFNGSCRLQKPFTAEQLARMVRERLQSSGL